MERNFGILLIKNLNIKKIMNKKIRHIEKRITMATSIEFSVSSFGF